MYSPLRKKGSELLNLVLDMMSEYNFIVKRSTLYSDISAYSGSLAHNVILSGELYELRRKIIVEEMRIKIERQFENNWFSIYVNIKGQVLVSKPSAKMKK